MLGNVKWFDVKKGYGYLTSPEIEGDIFVHQSAIVLVGHRHLVKDHVVNFTLNVGSRGKYAENVKVLGAGTLKLKEVAASIHFDDGFIFTIRPGGRSFRDSAVMYVHEGNLVFFSPPPYTDLEVCPPQENVWSYPWDAAEEDHSHLKPDIIWKRLCWPNGTRIREVAIRSHFVVEAHREGVVLVYTEPKMEWVFVKAPSKTTK